MQVTVTEAQKQKMLVRTYLNHIVPADTLNFEDCLNSRIVEKTKAILDKHKMLRSLENGILSHSDIGICCKNKMVIEKVAELETIINSIVPAYKEVTNTIIEEATPYVSRRQLKEIQILLIAKILAYKGDAIASNVFIDASVTFSVCLNTKSFSYVTAESTHTVLSNVHKSSTSNLLFNDYELIDNIIKGYLNDIQPTKEHTKWAKKIYAAIASTQNLTFEINTYYFQISGAFDVYGIGTERDFALKVPIRTLSENKDNEFVEVLNIPKIEEFIAHCHLLSEGTFPDVDIEN